MTPRREKRVRKLIAAWAVAALGASGAMMYAGLRPGADHPSAALAAVLNAGPAEHRPTLVLALHPRCPCTRATLGQLSRLRPAMGPVRLVALVYTPPNDAGWPDGAALLEPVAPTAVIRDEGGKLAASMGMYTSGAVRAYGPGGELLFAGGVTSARGHEGDCPASDALRRSVATGVGAGRPWPVFGCPLSADVCINSNEGAVSPCR